MENREGRRSALKTQMLLSMALCVCLFFTGRNDINAQSYLRHQFAEPSKEYGPWVFWMWMNGHVSKEGITLDLEAMNRVGINGAVLFTSDAGIPKGKIKYDSREWYDLNKHMFAEAERLGMKVMLHNCPGYSVSGGPWIRPENSMQQVVFSEAFVSGNNTVQSVKLPKPYAKMGYYEDALVIAYPSLTGEDRPMQLALGKISIDGIEADKQLITNYDYDNYVEIKKDGALLLEFDEPFDASSVIIRREHTDPPHHPYDGPRDDPPTLTLEYSHDGLSFTPVVTIGMLALRELNVPVSKNFLPVKARYYRIKTNKSTRLTEVFLYTAPRLENFERKANYIVRGNTDQMLKDIPSEYIIDPSEVIDLTTALLPDGTLLWQVPEGNWTILRIGHTTTGEENAAAPFESSGLECDKLNKRGIQNHYDGLLKKMFEEFGDYAGSSFYGLTVDSWEAGTQNWTKGFEKEYTMRQQKDITPYIAVFTGRIVGSVTSTENFLEEIRRLQATMVAENYHQALRDYCHQHGVSFANESYGDGPFNSIEVGKFVDIPLGEFWAHGTYGGSHTNNQAGYLARINNRKIAGAEAYTARPELSKFTAYPAEMKTMGDWMFTNGINRLMYHTYAHQPHSTVKPGMTMGPFGTHFNRNQTWWEQSKAYIDYVSRCQFMLQEGFFVSSSSLWIPTEMKSDETQQGKGIDFTFAAEKQNAVINYMHRRSDDTDYYFVCNGKRSFQRIIAAFDIAGKQPEIWHPETGKQYPVYNYSEENGKTSILLEMQPTESFFVVFNKPKTSAPLWDVVKDFRRREVEPFSYENVQNTFSISVWLRPDVDVLPGKNFVLFPLNVEGMYGRNHACVGLAVGQNGVCVSEQIGNGRKDVLFAETKIEGWSLVNVVYNNGKPVVYVNGQKIKEGLKSDNIIHPNNNEISPVDAVYNMFQGEYLTPVIDDKALSAKEISMLYKQGKSPPALPENVNNILVPDDIWTVSFPENSGAPKQIVLKNLASLHKHSNKGVKYFSGTATYSTTLKIPSDYVQEGSRIAIDFGNVAFFAEVSMNGKQLATLWKPPYACDVTDFIHAGDNLLEVKVTNLWTNRLIGDEFLPAENDYDKWGELDQFPDWYVNNQPYKGKRNTFVSWRQYDKNGPLTESGLIGPVRIYTY